MNIYIILFDGFDDLDVIAPYEVLKREASFNVASGLSHACSNLCIW
ncbi:hypothetical protein GNY06_06170 [Elizabethkingia argentiflava]|uniref:DJ-1/PfpI domain-containing protein n=1 Tax=Elizabethkingia argenteiflava TaxID=2681556 RepID=A0A845PVH0_9FLAO|nr:hypothetical protein [Elizabethkingia argenteiflava]NAW50971.1 hypothetical protein [Elizabethkingia argenteiflava]